MQQDTTYSPFLHWVAYMKKRRLAELYDHDIVIGTMGARRFAVGVHDEGYPVLGLNIYDSKALRAMNWVSAAIILGHENLDWIALGQKDVRDENSDISQPVPLRLWIQFPVTSLDPFKEINFSKIAAHAVKNSKGPETVFAKKALFEVPGSIKDKWTV